MLSDCGAISTLGLGQRGLDGDGPHRKALWHVVQGHGQGHDKAQPQQLRRPQALHLRSLPQLPRPATRTPGSTCVVRCVPPDPVHSQPCIRGTVSCTWLAPQGFLGVPFIETTQEKCSCSSFGSHLLTGWVECAARGTRPAAARCPDAMAVSRACRHGMGWTAASSGACSSPQRCCAAAPRSGNLRDAALASEVPNRRTAHSLCQDSRRLRQLMPVQLHRSSWEACIAA